MKKAILLLLFICALISTRVFAQNILITDSSNNVVNGTTISVESSDINVPTMDVYLNVKNNGDFDLNNLFVRRIINSEADTSYNSFCFGTCFLPTTDTSLVALILTPGQSTLFSGDYYPNQCSGLTSITYEFFDNRSGSLPVTAQIIVHYLLSPLGIVADLNMFNFSDAFPNPAASSTSFDYSLPAGSKGNIVVRNLLGSVVRDIKLDKQQGRITIYTNDLKEGVYFYSFILDSKSVVTKKLVIRH